MSMHKINCPTCLVEKPDSSKHVRKVEVKDGKKFFTCFQCDHDYELKDENPEHLVVGEKLR